MLYKLLLQNDCHPRAGGDPFRMDPLKNDKSHPACHSREGGNPFRRDPRLGGDDRVLLRGDDRVLHFATEKYKASAPGSLMLLGEYAVLHGHHAFVCAIDKRITVTLEARQDKKIEIISALGHFSAELSKLEIVSPFRFVLAVLKKHQKHLKSGCTITIESEFSDQMGFASSAAVTVATAAVVLAWQEIAYSPKQLIQWARRIVRTVQGIGSGADVAACVLGGMVAYRAAPFWVERLPMTHPLTVIYSGNKVPTVNAIKRVNTLFLSSPIVFRKLLQAIGSSAKAGIHAARQKNWDECGKLMNIQQGLMQALGVNTPLLNDIVEELQSDPHILGAKISGSGFGDCVVGLGSFKKVVVTGQSVPVTLSETGVQCEKIGCR